MNRSQFLNQFLGTFVFVTGCAAAGGDAWKMGGALFMALQCFSGSCNPAASLGDLFNGKFETDTFLDFGACAAGAMFAHHFGSMNFGGNDAHVTAFMGTFLLFSGFNAAKNNLDRALALAVASTCYSGTMNPAVSFANTMNNGFNNLSSGLFITIFFQVAGAFAAGKVKAFADAKA